MTKIESLVFITYRFNDDQVISDSVQAMYSELCANSLFLENQG